MITQNDLDKIKTVIDDSINREIKPINKQLKKIQNDLTTTINYFDHNFINHETRIKQIEHHLNLSSGM